MLIKWSDGYKSVLHKNLIVPLLSFVIKGKTTHFTTLLSLITDMDSQKRNEIGEIEQVLNVWFYTSLRYVQNKT